MNLTYWDKLMDRPKEQRIGLWVGSILLISYLLWLFVLSDLYKQSGELEEKKEKVEKEVVSETQRLNNLVQLRKEVDASRVLLDIALKRLPQKREIPSMLETITQLARNSGLDVRRFAPQADKIKNYYAEIAIDIEVKGTFHKVVTFLDELSRMPRVVTVKQLSMLNPLGYSGAEGVETEIKGVLTTYRYLEESERPKIEDTDKKAKRTRKGKE